MQDGPDIYSKPAGNEQIHNIIANSQYAAVYQNPDGDNPFAIFQPRNTDIRSNPDCINILWSLQIIKIMLDKLWAYAYNVLKGVIKTNAQAKVLP